MSQPSEYRTLRAPSRHEISKIKGSRFLGCAAPVQTREEAAAFVAGLKREFHDARHVCSAWRLGAGPEDFRFDDDGEPGGSAGRPILQQIVGHDLQEVIVAVVRWFGGTKLGVGGLVRAYGDAAAQVLEHAEIGTVVRKERIQVRYAYELSSALEALQAAEQLRPVSADYGTEVQAVFEVPLPRVDSFITALTDRSAARAHIERLGETRTLE